VLLAEEDAMQTEEEQQALLHLLGPLQDMLNSELRRRIWGNVPFRLLKVAATHVRSEVEAISQ